MKLSSLLYVDTNWRIDLNEELTCFHFPSDPKSQCSHTFQLSNQKLLSASQKSAQFFYSFLRYSQFPMTWVSTPIFSHTNPFYILAWMQKISPAIHYWDAANFRNLWPEWPCSSLTMPTEKNFKSTFSIHEFVYKRLGHFIHLF